MPKRILYWFRNDLRLHDNEAFARAVESADEVLPVYIIDPRWFDDVPQLGVRKTGVFRTNFLLESVTDLRGSLQAKGADLLVRIGNASKILAELAEDIGAEAVYASKEVTQEETDIESDLSKRLKPLNVDLELFWQSTLYHVRDLPFKVSRLPDIFTQFRNQLETYVPVRELVAAPKQVQVVTSPIEFGAIPTLASFGFPPEVTNDIRTAVPFKGGETVALARLERYIWEKELIRTYKETRNGMLGEDYSS